MSADAFVLCEPKRRGWDHARVNAALAASFALAAPGGGRVVLVAEPDHAARVRTLLEESAPGAAARLETVPVSIPPKNSAFRRRLPAEHAALAAALRRVRGGGARALCATSIDAPSLLLLRLLAGGARRAPPILAIQHDAFRDAAEGLHRGLLRARFSFPRVVGWRRPASLRVVLLGEFILANVHRAWPAAARRCVAVDLPCLAVEPVTGPPPHAPLRFGFLGAGAKGFDAFLDVARRVRAARPDGATFHLAGFLNESRHAAQLAGIRETVPDAGTEPLPDTEYRRRIAGLTYVVGASEVAPYTYRVNATFLEAIGFGIPVAALANPCLEHYFRTEGAMGYLERDVDALSKRLIGLIDRFPSDEYAAQRAAMARGRERFRPATAAARWREILTEVDGREGGGEPRT